jgi:hypothetical protein
MALGNKKRDFEDDKSIKVIRATGIAMRNVSKGRRTSEKLVAISPKHRLLRKQRNPIPKNQRTTVAGSQSNNPISKPPPNQRLSPLPRKTMPQPTQTYLWL